MLKIFQNSEEKWREHCYHAKCFLAKMVFPIILFVVLQKQKQKKKSKEKKLNTKLWNVKKIYLFLYTNLSSNFVYILNRMFSWVIYGISDAPNEIKEIQMVKRYSLMVLLLFCLENYMWFHFWNCSKMKRICFFRFFSS